MVSSSKPSHSQSRRGPAPSFSNGKTRKIPCGPGITAAWEDADCGAAIAGTPDAAQTARHANNAKVRFIERIVTERETFTGPFTSRFTGNEPRTGRSGAARLWQLRVGGLGRENLLRFRKL